MASETEKPFMTVTKAAAAQVRQSMDRSDADGMGLRLAVRMTPSGEFDYVMGFDERAPGDITIVSHGVDVLVAEGEREQVEGMTLDFVELEPGQYEFIFINPNDPNYSPPTQSD